MSSSVRAPIKICVIQLARMGDTLQSLMALRAAKQLYPELEITLIVRDAFAAPARRTSWIHEVKALPVSAIVQGDDESSLKTLAKWATPLVQNRWDIVMNWTFSESSSYLAALLPARVRFGYSRNSDFSIKAVDGWTQYVQGVIQGGVPQNIHLTDILTTQLLTALQIHVGDPAQVADPAENSRSFFQLQLDRTVYSQKLIDASTQWVAIQIGASTESKIYPPKHWAEVIRLILDRHPQYKIILLGNEEDAPREKMIRDCLNQNGLWEERVLSVVGETDFDLWATLLHRSVWCLATDTAVIPLASILGTRCINVSVGPVRFSETGPYGNGHLVVSQMNEIPNPKLVYTAFSFAHLPRMMAQSVTFESHCEELKLASLPRDFRIFRTRIRSTEEGGGVQYEPVTFHRQNEDEWLSMAVGHIARAWYCGWTPKLGRELTRTALSPTLLGRLRKLEESVQVLSKIFKEARSTSSALAFKSGRMKSDHLMSLQKKNDLQELTHKLLDLEGLADRLVETEPLLAGFVHLSKVLMHNLDGAMVSELSKQSAQAYKQLEEGIALLNDWIQYSLRLAKPVSLANVRKIKEDKTL